MYSGEKDSLQARCDWLSITAPVIKQSKHSNYPVTTITLIRLFKFSYFPAWLHGVGGAGTTIAGQITWEISAFTFTLIIHTPGPITYIYIYIYVQNIQHSVHRSTLSLNIININGIQKALQIMQTQWKSTCNIYN